MTLEDFAMPLKIRRLVGDIVEDEEEIEAEICEFPTKAYGLDKSISGNGKKKTLKGQYGMHGTHCCDYLLINDKNVLLLEDSNIGKTKENWERKYPDEKLSVEMIAKEQLLKAYASLLLLCKISCSDRSARRLIKDKEIAFCVVCNDIENKDLRLLDGILKHLKDGSLAKLVSKVRVLPCSALKGLIADYPAI